MISINGTPIHIETYPNGESRIDMRDALRMISKPTPSRSPIVRLHYESDIDIVHLALVKDHLDHLHPNRYELFIDYMPYSRMDRLEDGMLFSLRSIARQINQLGFDRVTVVEPHSDVTIALLDRAFPIYWTKIVLPDVMKAIGYRPDVDSLAYPDAGADKRYKDTVGYNTIIGLKHRDVQTGKITGMSLSGYRPIQTADTPIALIVDDLSSYGGTFIGASTQLRQIGFKKVYLLVAHAEDSIFKKDLLDHIDGLHCTDSITHSRTDPKVHVHLLQPALYQPLNNERMG